MKAQLKPKDIMAEYRWIDSSYGKLKLLIARGKGKGEKCTGVLWMHGGGFLSGMSELIYNSRAMDLLREENVVIVSPAYSLSLLHPYPVALTQCHEALVWMKKHAGELGIRTDQIMVGGESAGGNLAVAVCMYALDHKSVSIAFQMPIYPMLDCYDTDSSRDNHEKGWNTRKNHLAWKLYLRDLDDKPGISEYASPARRNDYAGLPPCYTFVGTLDPFHDETLSYIDRLKEAGIEAKADVYEDFYHGFDMINPRDAKTMEASRRFVEEFRRARNNCFVRQENEEHNGI